MLTGNDTTTLLEDGIHVRRHCVVQQEGWLLVGPLQLIRQRGERRSGPKASLNAGSPAGLPAPRRGKECPRRVISTHCHTVSWCFGYLAGAVGHATLRPLAVAVYWRPQLFRARSEEHTSELQSQSNLVCRLLLEQ